MGDEQISRFKGKSEEEKSKIYNDAVKEREKKRSIQQTDLKRETDVYADAVSQYSKYEGLNGSDVESNPVLAEHIYRIQEMMSASQLSDMKLDLLKGELFGGEAEKLSELEKKRAECESNIKMFRKKQDDSRIYTKCLEKAISIYELKKKAGYDADSRQVLSMTNAMKKIRYREPLSSTLNLLLQFKKDKGASKSFEDVIMNLDAYLSKEDNQMQLTNLRKAVCSYIASHNSKWHTQNGRTRLQAMNELLDTIDSEEGAIIEEHKLRRKDYSGAYEDKQYFVMAKALSRSFKADEGKDKSMVPLMEAYSRYRISRCDFASMNTKSNDAAEIKKNELAKAEYRDMVRDRLLDEIKKYRKKHKPSDSKDTADRLLCVDNIESMVREYTSGDRSEYENVRKTLEKVPDYFDASKKADYKKAFGKDKTMQEQAIAMFKFGQLIFASNAYGADNQEVNAKYDAIDGFVNHKTELVKNLNSEGMDAGMMARAQIYLRTIFYLWEAKSKAFEDEVARLEKNPPEKLFTEAKEERKHELSDAEKKELAHVYAVNEAHYSSEAGKYMLALESLDSASMPSEFSSTNSAFINKYRALDHTSGISMAFEATSPDGINKMRDVLPQKIKDDIANDTVKCGETILKKAGILK